MSKYPQLSGRDAVFLCQDLGEIFNFEEKYANYFEIFWNYHLF